MSSNALKIKSYIVREFAPDVAVAELEPSYDLLENGLVDSLGLLRLISWVSDEYAIPIDEIDISPEDFRSVNAIDAFVTGATANAA